MICEKELQTEKEAASQSGKEILAEEKREDKVVYDLEICRDIDLLKEADRIILYGAGGKGKEIYTWLKETDIKVDLFCDMDMKKWGDHIEDIEIISPFMLSGLEDLKDKITYMIACIPYPQELCDLLKQMDLHNIRVISYFGIKTALEIHAGYIFGEESKRTALFKVENGSRKNKLVNIWIGFLRNLLVATHETIWVIQPGKTASSSLESRLHENGLSHIKEHVLGYPDHLLGEGYRDIWEKCVQESKRSMKAIVAVREPLARDYSAFWQPFTRWSERNTLMSVFDGDFQHMYDDFTELILNGSTYAKEKLGCFMPCIWVDQFRWFDEQIKKYLDIDVFQYPFDKEKGYTIIKKDHIDMFLFKVEKMEEISDEIALFAGAPKMSKTNTNMAQQKWYGLAYAQFMKEIKLPRGYVDHYYRGNPRMDYFYTQKEKDAFLEKWEKNISS